MRPLILAVSACLLANAQAHAPLSPDAAGVFPIWPGTPPGSESWTWHEQVRTMGSNRMVRNVAVPTLTMYKPAAPNGASVIIAPGGAFRFLMVDYEGVDVARWLVQRGITAFVLRYRVVHTPEDEQAMNRYLAELTKHLQASNSKSDSVPEYDAESKAGLALAEEDGRQAIRYVRAHAAEWSLDPHRIGIVGFSAGGGVVMGPVIEHDANSRPDFAAPIYPAYRTATPVPADAPPLFIAIADDDNLIAPGSSARLYMAWHAAGKPAELHIFKRGGHGFGMRKTGGPSDAWIELFHAWMNSLGMLKPAVSRMFVFGDSYSDMGAGYVDGDGPTAVGYLASRLGFKLLKPSDPAANNGSINFAVSGAQTGRGDGRKIKDSLLGRGMANQVEDFVSRSIRFDPSSTLFYIAGGLNDGRLPSSETVANLKAEIKSLYDAGARRIRLAILPEAIPSFSAVAQRLNPELQRIPAEIAPTLPGIEIQMSRWGAYFDEVMRNPSAYGIENTKDACAGRALFDQDPTPCPKPAAYFYYHAGHPSTAVHKIAGDKLYAELTAARE